MAGPPGAQWIILTRDHCRGCSRSDIAHCRGPEEPPKDDKHFERMRRKPKPSRAAKVTWAGLGAAAMALLQASPAILKLLAAWRHS